MSAKTDNLDPPPPPSKSERKRDAERLQSIGRRLVGLNPEQLDALALPPSLRRAIIDYLRFPSREARRRQLQFIGKVMRNINTDAVEAHLADLDGESARAQYLFNQLEQWRDDLISDPQQTLTRFISAYPEVDRQQLRRLTSKVTRAKTTEQHKTNARTLFRFLRKTLAREI